MLRTDKQRTTKRPNPRKGRVHGRDGGGWTKAKNDAAAEEEEKKAKAKKKKSDSK